MPGLWKKWQEVTVRLASWPWLGAELWWAMTSTDWPRLFQERFPLNHYYCQLIHDDSRWMSFKCHAIRPPSLRLPLHTRVSWPSIIVALEANNKQPPWPPQLRDYELIADEYHSCELRPSWNRPNTVQRLLPIYLIGGGIARQLVFIPRLECSSITNKMAFISPFIG